jgi:FAD/FMN-containing dehydrogenase
MDRRRFITNTLGAGIAASFPGSHLLAQTVLHNPTKIPGDIDALKLNGAQTTLKQAAIQELSDSLKGKLILPEHAAYDTARWVLNPRYDKYPAFIVQPTGPADVQNAIDFARENSLLLAVKCGGHASAGTSSCDKGMQIDLSRMRHVRVDPFEKTARVAGGSLLGELDHEAMSHGLVTTAGTVSHTGVGGLTLGGGFGRLQRRFGLTIDNALEMDIVTPDGKLRRVSERNEPDLFWALRGGGGNFGVVTSFLFQLHKMQRKVVRGYLLFPFTEAKQIVNFFAEYSDSIPDELSLGAGIGGRLGQDPVAMLSFIWSGKADKFDPILADLKKAGTIIKESASSMDYVAVQRSGDIVDTRTFTGHVKSGFFKQFDSSMIDDLVDNFEAHPDRSTRVYIGRMGGAVGRVKNEDTAFAHRDANFEMLSFISWKTGADEKAHIDYINAHYAQLEPKSTGFYVNDYFDQTQQQVNGTYRDNFPRLLKIKQSVDPQNLFRLNANIKAV